MKTLYWDSGDPLDVWGNPNLRWGNPSYRLEPGDPGYVEWFPPGYTPPVSPPKPRRHSHITLESLNLPPDMQPFRYIIQRIKDMFTSRPALRPAMSEADYLDALATRSALPRPQVEALLRAQAGLHVELARQTIPVGFVLKLFRLQPLCGGNLSGPDPADEELRDTLGYSVIIHPDEIDKVRVDCPMEKSGDAAENVPTVTSVRARPGNMPNKYAVGSGRSTEVNGTNFRAGRSNAPWPTAELVDDNGGNPVTVNVADCTGPTRLILEGAPADTTGTRFLKLTDADGNFSVSDQPLTPHTA